MAEDEATAFKKGLLKKDKLELVKILKAKKQPTNGSKADLVDRILAYDEKNGGKMARKATQETDEPPPYDEDVEEDAGEGDVESAPIKKKKEKKQKKPARNRDDDDNGGRAGGGGGGGGGGVACSPNVDCAPGFVGVAQVLTTLAAVGQLILGIIQFILLAENLDNVCDDDFQECVGNALYWESGGDETDSFNTPWRAVFTLRPSYFFTNWTPMLFGVIAIMQCFTSTTWDFVSGTWLKCMLFNTFLFLFAAFGYCGQAGIIIGFVEVTAAALCLIMIFVDRGGGNTYLKMNF